MENTSLQTNGNDWLIAWLIDWLDRVYAVSEIFQPCNTRGKDVYAVMDQPNEDIPVFYIKEAGKMEGREIFKEIYCFHLVMSTMYIDL